jgi:hypothetical protein
MIRRCAGAMLLLAALAGAQAVPPQRSSAGDRAQQRAAWFLSFRQSRDGETPAAHLLQAWRQTRHMPVIRPRRRQLQAGSPATLGGNWTELGPRPETDPYYGAIAGRMTAIAVDIGKDPSGNTVYLGAADGGVWMSTNALSASPTFTPIGDNLPSLAVGAVALDDSTTPTTIYVGTGEANGSGDSYYGLGIYKSTDGGATWIAGTGVNFFGSAIGKLLVDPASPNIVLAAVTEGGVFVENNLLNTAPAIGIVRSTDGGATWSQVYSGASATDLIYDAGTYYAAIRGNGIYASSDQGATWQRRPSVFGSAIVTGQNFYRASLAVRGGVLFALVADAGGTPTQPSDCGGSTACAGLVESQDGGETWSALALPSGLYGSNHQGDYDQFLAAPANSSLLLAGGIDVWKEDLAKLGWTNLTDAYGTGTVHADEHAIAVLGPQTWIIANDGGAWSTADAGTSWTNMNATIGAIQFYGVTPDPTTAGRLLGGSQDNGTVLDTAAALGWPEVFVGDGGHTAINPQNPQQLFTENYNVSVQCSSDGGKTFNPVVDTTAIAEPTPFYVPLLLAPSDPATMYLIGQRVWRGPACPSAVNTGWQAISTSLIHPSDSPFLDGTNDVLTALAAAPSSPGVLYAGAFDGSLSVTTNATVSGALPTWTEAPAGTPPTFQGPISAIAVDPTNPSTVYWGMGYVGGQATLYKSADGGKTAVDIAGNLPGTPINAIVVDPGNPNDIFVATDVGVFAAGDGGAQGANERWARVGDNLPAAAVLSLALADSGGTPALIAGTHGRGAWSIPAIVPPAFTMTLTPGSLSVEAGQPAVYTVQTAAVGGPSTIALSCNLPSGCVITPASIPAGGSATVTVTESSAFNAPGLVTITGDNGFASQNQTAALTVLDFLFEPKSEFTPVSATAQLGETVAVPFFVENQLAFGPSLPPPYDAPITFSCPDAPAGVTCTFAPASVTGLTGTQTGTATVQIGDTTVPDAYKMHLQAVGGQVTHTIELDLQANAFALSAPATVTAAAGATASIPVTSSSLSGFTGNIALSCAAAYTYPPTSCAMQPAAVTAGQPSTALLNGFAPGDMPIPVTITGVSGGSADRVQVNLQPAGFFLNPKIGAAITGSNTSVGTVGVAGSYGYAAPVTLSCSGNPGLQCSFNPPQIAPGASAAMTVTGLAGVPASSNIPLTVVGTAGPLQRSQSVTLGNQGGLSLSVLHPNISILPGDPAAFAIFATATGGYLGPIAVGCGTGLAPAASCAYQLAQLTVSGLAGAGALPVPIVASITQGGVTISQTASASVTIGSFSLQPYPPANNTVTRGTSRWISASVNATLNLQPTPVSVTCSVPAASGVTCAPPPVAQFVVPNYAVDVQVTASSQAGAVGGTSAWLGGFGGGGLAVLLGCGLVLGRRRRRALALVGLLTLACVACGGGGPIIVSNGGGSGGSGGGSGSGGGGSAPPGPTVPLTITVTDATPGVANPVSQSVVVPLTVN